MNDNKRLIILIVIGIIFILVISFLLYNFLIQRPIIENINIINENINQVSEETILEKARENISKIKKEGIPYNIYYQLLEFLTFCNVKNNNIPYFQECSNIFNFYLYDPTPFREETINKWCRYDSYFILFYFLKQNQKEEFMKICEEYRKNNLLIDDCQNAWETKFYEEANWCDDEQYELCWPILEGESAEVIEQNFNKYEGFNNLANCTNKVKIDKANLNELKNLTCKKFLPLRRAVKVDDCKQIEDTLARLVCLSQFESGVCTEAKEAIANYKILEFIDRYDLKNCCFQGNKQGKSKYTNAVE